MSLRIQPLAGGNLDGLIHSNSEISYQIYDFQIEGFDFTCLSVASASAIFHKTATNTDYNLGAAGFDCLAYRSFVRFSSGDKEGTTW